MLMCVHICMQKLFSTVNFRKKLERKKKNVFKLEKKLLFQ